MIIKCSAENANMIMNEENKCYKHSRKNYAASVYSNLEIVTPGFWAFRQSGAKWCVQARTDQQRLIDIAVNFCGDKLLIID